MRPCGLPEIMGGLENLGATDAIHSMLVQVRLSPVFLRSSSGFIEPHHSLNSILFLEVRKCFVSVK